MISRLLRVNPSLYFAIISLLRWIFTGNSIMSSCTLLCCIFSYFISFEYIFIFVPFFFSHFRSFCFPSSIVLRFSAFLLSFHSFIFLHPLVCSSSSSYLSSVIILSSTSCLHSSFFSTPFSSTSVLLYFSLTSTFTFFLISSFLFIFLSPSFFFLFPFK